MCFDKNESIHLHVHVGLLSALKWGFLCFPILGLSGSSERRLQPHQIKTKRREELPSSTMTPNSFFFLLFYSLPSIVFVAQDQGVTIDQSNIFRAWRYVFFAHKDVGFFGIMCVLCFFSTLGVCNLNLALNIFSIFFLYIFF
jgi:hypothetical protein